MARVLTTKRLIRRCQRRYADKGNIALDKVGATFPSKLYSTLSTTSYSSPLVGVKGFPCNKKVWILISTFLTAGPQTSYETSGISMTNKHMIGPLWYARMQSIAADGRHLQSPNGAVMFLMARG